MNIMKKKDKAPDITPVNVDNPAVEFEDGSVILDQINHPVLLRQYRNKHLVLMINSLKLKNAPVAYLDGVALLIDCCIDYTYGENCSVDQVIARSIGSAMGNGRSCVLLKDEQNNYHLCALDRSFSIDDIIDFLDPALPSSRKTYIETLGITFISNCAIIAIITTDGALLKSQKDDFDIADNAHYFIFDISVDQGRLAALVWGIKSRPLESKNKREDL